MSSPSNHDLAGGRFEQFQQRAADRRFAAAALADKPQRLAAPDLERDAVDRVDLARDAREHAGIDREMLFQILDLEQRAGHCRRRARRAGHADSRAGGRRASRRPNDRGGAVRAAETRRGTVRSRSRSAAQSCIPAAGRASDGTMPLISLSRARRHRCAPPLRGSASSRAAPRIGMSGAVEQIVGARLLDLAPGIHHDHAVGILGDDAHVMRDQDDRRAERLLQFAHQVEDLRLDRHIERGRRLIGDQQLRVARQRHRDHHALPHAAGKLVRIGVHAALRLRDVDAAQHLDRPVHRVARATRPGAARSLR